MTLPTTAGSVRLRRRCCRALALRKMMRTSRLLVAIFLITGCTVDQDRKLVAEYHKSAIAREEGTSSLSKPYTLELQEALSNMTSRGELRHQIITFPTIAHNRTNVASILATTRRYTRHVVDAALPYAPTNPLQLELYYYPDDQIHIHEMLKEIDPSGQHAASGDVGIIR